MVIKYDFNSDLYNLRVGSYNKKTFEITEEIFEGIYCDGLREIICRHFKFEYVMEALIASMRRD